MIAMPDEKKTLKKPIALFLVHPPERKILACNPSAERLFGYRTDEMIGKSTEMLHIDTEHFRSFGRMSESALERDGFFESDFRMKRKNGEVFDSEHYEIPGFDLEGWRKGVISVVRDISVLKSQHAAWQESEAANRVIIDSLPAHIAVLDRTAKILRVNQAWQNFAAANGAEGHPSVCAGANYLDICFKAMQAGSLDARKALKGIRSVLDGEEESFKMEYDCHSPEKKRWFLMHVTALPEVADLTCRAVVTHIDTTAFRVAQTALKESEEKYRVAFNSMPEAITITRVADNQYVYVNDTFTRLTGYTRQEVLGRKPSDLNLFVESADRDRLLRMLNQAGEVRDLEMRFRHKDQFVFDTLLSARIMKYEGMACVFAVAKDITGVKEAEREKARLEVQLQQAQKMESLGALSGGIAHDFNNILGAIWGYGELALVSLQQEDVARSYLEEVIKACKRAKDLIMQILAFSRKQPPDRLPVRVHLVLKEVLELLRASLPSTIEIRTNIEKGSDIVQADPTQLHQVIMNLCTNAFHAMRATGGVLDIKQNPVFLGDNNARRYNLDPGFYLKLSVRDTGKGISPEIMKRIFEPYVTTRPREQGTGLGLAVAQGIVTSHGGTIVAYSQQGKGSRFDVYLPLSDLPVEATSDNIADFPTGRERILFVDDEQALVNIARRMLESLGYQVMAMNDAHSALAAFREDPSAFDLVMTDLTMPGMTGIELASQVHDLRPATPIVLLTGYSEEAAQDVEHNAGIHRVLVKPFSFRQLAESARKVLDSRAGLGTGGN